MTFKEDVVSQTLLNLSSCCKKAIFTGMKIWSTFSFFVVVFLFSHQVGKYNFSFSSIFFQLLTLDNLVRVNARACAHWRPPRACPAGMCVAGVCLRCVLKARSILGPGNLPQMKLDSVPGERREQTFQSCRKSISTWWGSPAPPPILLSLPPLPPLCPLSLSPHPSTAFSSVCPYLALPSHLWLPRPS